MLLRNNPFRDIFQLFSPSQATQLLPDGTNFSSSFPCRCGTANSPFKPLVRFRTSSDGGRLSPHPFNILSLLFNFVLAKRQCAAPNLPATCRSEFAFQTVCVLLRFVYGGRLSPHPSGSVPVQIHLSNCLRIADSLCTAGGSRRTLPAMCRFKFAFQTACAFLHFV